MIAKLLNLTASPTTVEEDVDGANIEYTDILLSNGTFWSSIPKILRGDELLDLSLEEAGVATRPIPLMK